MSLSELCNQIAVDHHRATALLGDSVADLDANAREIGEVSDAMNADIQRVIATQAATLAEWRAKAEILLLVGPDDELATSLAHDLLAAA